MGDLHALRRCCRRLIAEPALRQRLGRAGRARVQQLFSPEREATAVEAPDRLVARTGRCSGSIDVTEIAQPLAHLGINTGSWLGGSSSVWWAPAVQQLQQRRGKHWLSRELVVSAGSCRKS